MQTAVKSTMFYINNIDYLETSAIIFYFLLIL